MALIDSAGGEHKLGCCSQPGDLAMLMKFTNP